MDAPRFDGNVTLRRLVEDRQDAHKPTGCSTPRPPPGARLRTRGLRAYAARRLWEWWWRRGDEPLRARLNVSKAPGGDPRVQDATFYMGFAEGFMNSKSNFII